MLKMYNFPAGLGPFAQILQNRHRAKKTDSCATAVRSLLHHRHTICQIICTDICSRYR